MCLIRRRLIWIFQFKSRTAILVSFSTRMCFIYHLYTVCFILSLCILNLCIYSISKLYTHSCVLWWWHHSLSNSNCCVEVVNCFSNPSVVLLFPPLGRISRNMCLCTSVGNKMNTDSSCFVKWFDCITPNFCGELFNIGLFIETSFGFTVDYIICRKCLMNLIFVVPEQFAKTRNVKKIWRHTVNFSFLIQTSSMCQISLM